jgi:hypothetical protein
MNRCLTFLIKIFLSCGHSFPGLILLMNFSHDLNLLQFQRLCILVRFQQPKFKAIDSANLVKIVPITWTPLHFYLNSFFNEVVR